MSLHTRGMKRMNRTATKPTMRHSRAESLRGSLIGQGGDGSEAGGLEGVSGNPLQLFPIDRFLKNLRDDLSVFPQMGDVQTVEPNLRARSKEEDGQKNEEKEIQFKHRLESKKGRALRWVKELSAKVPAGSFLPRP